MTDRRCSHCGAQLPRHYTPGPCPGDPALARLPLSPAVRLVTPPVRDESVLRAFAAKEER